MRPFAYYLDLDGVEADYAAGMVALGYSVDPALGRDLNRSGTHHPLKREMYERIKGTEFYRYLPLQEGAIALYQAAARQMQGSPVILTAAPKFGATEDDFHINPHWLGAAYQKRSWVEYLLLPAVQQGYPEDMVNEAIARKVFLGTRVPVADEAFICTTSVRKQQFIHRTHGEHQVLVDDRIANVTAWAEAGGIGIFHRSSAESIEAMQQLARDGIFAPDFKAVEQPGSDRTAALYRCLMIDGPEGVVSHGFVPSYERKGFYTCEEVHARIGEVEHVDFDGDLIDMGSARYRLFAQSLACVSCGIEGAFYAKERAARFSKSTQTYHATTNKWHFNLYAVDCGKLILMTKDHIIPKSRGGGNIDSNYQTMCQPCNMRKSNRMPGESDRDFYLQRRPNSTDPRNRAQRAADRRNKREIVKTIKREDAAGGSEITHVAWGGYSGGDDTGEPLRMIYARNYLVFNSDTPRHARLFQTDGVRDQEKCIVRGWWWPNHTSGYVVASEAIGFGSLSAALAYMKGLHEAADVLEAADV